MQCYSYRLATPKGIDLCTKQFQALSTQKHSAILVSIFTGWFQESWILTLSAKVHELLPDALIIGSTTSGEIVAGEISEFTTLLNVMVFSQTELKLRLVDLSTISAEDAARDLTVTSQAEADLAGIELLIANNDARTYAFLSQLSQCRKELPIFGGVAGSTNNVSPYVFACDKLLHEGIVAVVFKSQSLQIHVGTSQGWCPLGPWFHITKMANDNVILELDHQPAALVYEKYLAIAPEDFAKGTLLFPLFLERNGHRMLRLPEQARADGSLKISADCHLGERLRLAYGDPDQILSAARDTQQELLGFAPEAIVLFNCVTRRFFLQEAANQELLPFEELAPSSGYYTAGEVARSDDGDLSLLNMTLVFVSFSEGEKTPARRETKPTAAKHELSSSMKLVQHLTHFISVVSSELEELACRDRLTNLFNRGEIESILQRELSDRRQGKRTVSAIMVDLDNFKAINDTYGHDVGDEILIWAAQVMQQNIRRGDAVGRWGGEEFLIVLPGASSQSALLVAERIRLTFTQGRTLPDGKSITASLGIAEFCEENSYMDCYRKLDSALYQAKQRGKNQSYIAE